MKPQFLMNRNRGFFCNMAEDVLQSLQLMFFFK